MTDTIHADTIDVAFLDSQLGLLSDPCRRGVVGVLAERRAEMALDDLAVALTDGGTDSDGGGRSNGARRETQCQRPTRDLLTELHHVHLPKLEDAGVLDYDRDANTVAPRETDEVTRLLEAAIDESDAS